MIFKIFSHLSARKLKKINALEVTSLFYFVSGRKFIHKDRSELLSLADDSCTDFEFNLLIKLQIENVI